jgi:hypothetical protein
MSAMKVTLIVIGVVVVAALALHFFGGDLMDTLRAMHGPR